MSSGRRRPRGGQELREASEAVRRHVERACERDGAEGDRVVEEEKRGGRGEEEV